jgi:hypothetical protein
MSVLKEGMKETKVIYELTPDSIKTLIANDLNVSVDRVSVHYVIQEVGGDPLDRYRGTDTVTKIMVTVK